MTDWDLSCPDWQDRIRTGRSLMPKLPLFREAADRAVGIFNSLRLYDVPDTPTLEKGCGDWFREFVEAMHGSFDPVANERMIREFFILVPKKNSKTSYGALFILVSLLVAVRPSAKFIAVAPTQDISEMAFLQVEGAAYQSKILRDRLHVQTHLKKITDRKTGAFMEVMSFHPDVLTGQKISGGALVDELHELGARAKSASAIRQLRGGMLPFPEAFLGFITTQSDKEPAGVFKENLARARAIRDGRATGRMLPLLYEFPDDIAKGGRAGEEHWRDTKNWWMVNPNRDRSLKIDRLIADFDDKKDSGDASLREWASQHLNIEMGVGMLTNAWPGTEFWEQAADPELVSLEVLLERCEVVTVGIDGGGLDDLLGLAIIGREKETRRWLCWCKAWCHKSVLERRKSEAARLLDFAAAGELIIVDDPGADIEQVVATVQQVDEAGLLAGVGLDRAGIGAIVDALAEAGIGGEEIVPGERNRVQAVPQSFMLMGAIKTVERKLVNRTLVHAPQALMNWCVGNAKVEVKSNYILITKQISGTAKIDPLMALFDAAALMSLNPEAMGGSIFDRSELWREGEPHGQAQAS